MLVIAGTAFTLNWLLDIAGPDASRRLEAIKIAFTVGLAGGGSIALLLALRRQWLQERTQAHAEHVAADNARHSERVAESAEHDATERRVTELYIKAAEQLGSSKAPVRLAAMFALERLGQSSPTQRPTVGKLLCAYLRMPFARPPGDPTVWGTVNADEAAPDLDGATAREELEVRLTAQRILSSHLHEGRPDAFWPELDELDLSGAYLKDFALNECRIGAVTLTHAILDGGGVFRSMRCDLFLAQDVAFQGHVDFRGAELGDCWLYGSKFDSTVFLGSDEHLPGTHFKQFASFAHSSFDGQVSFQGTRFSAAADFANTQFVKGNETLRLDEAQIENPNATSPEVGHKATVWPSGWAFGVGERTTTLAYQGSQN